MPSVDMPAAEVGIDADLVRRLVAAQFPPWSGLPVAPLAEGWDNAVYRLGSDLVVRLPRRQLGADLIEKEQRWLPGLTARLPLPVPAPVGFGVAGEGYPWRWSVCPWLAGRVAAATPPSDMDTAARDLGAFVRALGRRAPADAPRNEFRGVPLSDRDGRTRDALAALGDTVDSTALLEVWQEALAAPAWSGPEVWVHGDLHPANLLVDGGRLSAVIDFGDLCSGDPATDLMSGWMLLPATARAAFRRAAGADDATWERGRGWALAIGAACLANSANHSIVAGIGRRALEEILAERP